MKHNKQVLGISGERRAPLPQSAAGGQALAYKDDVVLDVFHSATKPHLENDPHNQILNPGLAEFINTIIVFILHCLHKCPWRMGTPGGGGGAEEPHNKWALLFYQRYP